MALHVDIELDFVPVVGMEIVSDKWFTGKLQRVIWCNQEAEFTLVAEDEVPSSDCEPEFLLNMLLKRGWLVEKEQ